MLSLLLGGLLRWTTEKGPEMVVPFNGVSWEPFLRLLLRRLRACPMRVVLKRSELNTGWGEPAGACSRKGVCCTQLRRKSELRKLASKYVAKYTSELTENAAGS